MASIGRSLVDVGVALVLKDQFSKEAGRISASFGSMMKDMSNWSRGIQMTGSGFSEYGVKMLSGMAQAYKYSAGVHKEVWMTSKIAGATLTEQTQLMNLAKDINEQTPLTAAQVASSSRYLAMAGNKVKAIKNMMPSISKLSSILGVDPGGKGGVADMMTNIMSMFQIPMDQASKVSDDLYTATTNANISLEDLAASIRYSGADMKAAGVNLRELAAATGVLGDMGIQGSMAGTSLANMVRNLQLSLSEQKQMGASWLSKLGLSPKDFYDAQGGFKGLYNAFEQFKESYKKLNALGRTQAFYNVFGVRGMRGILPILNDMISGNDKMKTIMDTYDKNSGIVNRVNDEYMKTMPGIIDRMNSTLENLKVTFGKSVSPVFSTIASMVSGIAKWVDKISQTWGGSYLIQVATVGTIIGTIVAGYRTMASVLRMVSTFQTIATKSATGMTSATVSTNSAFVVMESHLIKIGTMMNEILMMQMTMAGLTKNSAGQWIWAKTGRYAKVPKTGFSFTPLMGGLGGGAGKKAAAVGGGSMLAGGTSTFARWAIKQGLSKGVTRGLGAALVGASRLAGLIPGWGMAISLAVPLLISAFDKNTASVDQNTQALDRDKIQEAIRKQNEKAFINAVKVAIREGMNESNIKVTVDGDATGNFMMGSGSPDYTGGALLGLG